MKRPVRTKAKVFHLVQKNKDVLKSLGVKRLGVFGSFARNKPSVRSDVDLLVEFEPEKKSFDNFLQLAIFLENLLGRRVELVTPESLSPYLGPRIIQEVEYVPIFG